MARIARLALSLILFSLIVATSASADPIVVSSGFLTAPREPPGTVSLRGTRGFSLEGRIDPFEGRVDPLLGCNPCLPGTHLSVGGNLSGSVFSGPATLDGTTYPSIWGADSPASLFFEIFGGTAIPAFQNAPTTVRTPFTALGKFFVPYPGLPVGFRAGGFATVHLMPTFTGPGDPPAWYVQSVRYDFVDPSTVPEPATLGLVSIGLLAVVRRRRKASTT
jgi:hypothetical protein